MTFLMCLFIFLFRIAQPIPHESVLTKSMEMGAFEMISLGNLPGWKFISNRRQAANPPPRTSSQMQIAIEDNGYGIPDEIKDKILQPFFTTKKGTEGTGLGRSITHDIIKAHGGELIVASIKNEKTVFSIRLPKQQNNL